MPALRARTAWLGRSCLIALCLASAAGAREPPTAGPNGAAAPAAPAAPAEAGVWQEQDLQFDYVGYTMHYTCSSLRERMLLVLRLMGARADASSVTGCGDNPRFVDRFPYVHAHFATLVPAPAGAAPAVAGQWREVDLVGSGKLDPNECELMEQIVDQLVPRFAARNVAKPGSCVPHTETRTLALHMEVFAPPTPVLR